MGSADHYPPALCRAAASASPRPTPPRSRRRSPSCARTSTSRCSFPRPCSPTPSRRAARLACRRPTRPRSRSSPSTRRSRWTSTRRCTSSATAAATSSTTRSPTSPPSSSRAARSTPRRTAAARRSTARLQVAGCTRRCSPRARRRLLPDQVAPGAALDDPGRRDRRGHRRRRRAGAGAQPREARLRRRPALDRRRQRRRVAAAARARSGCSARSASGARRGRAAAARAGGRPPDRRLRRWSSARCSRSRTGTRRSRCSPGMAAAALMVYARVGLLRTLPPPDPRDVERLHRTARALGIDWPAEQLYPRLHPLARPGAARPRRDAHRVHPAAARQRVRRLRRRGAGRPAHAGVARSTPTSPRRCAGSATGTPARSAWRSAPARTCPAGCATRCPRCRRRWRRRTAAPTSTRPG